jgi:hypothetical protein
MDRVVNASPAQEGTLREYRASSGRYWASSLIKCLRVTTGEPPLQTRNRKTRTLRHAGGYKETDRSGAVAVVKFMTASVNAGAIMHWCDNAEIARDVMAPGPDL